MLVEEALKGLLLQVYMFNGTCDPLEHLLYVSQMMILTQNNNLLL